MSTTPLKFSYAKIPNMGDLLNELILDHLFHISYHNVERWTDWDLLGIGSNLISAFPRKYPGFHPLWKIRHLRDGWIKPRQYIWGTGFMIEPDVRRYTGGGWLRFLAIRGALSKAIAEQLCGQKLDVVLGDGGLLASLLLQESIPKTHQVGLIPHFKEKAAPQAQWLYQKYPEALQIDLQKDPLLVVQQIAQCEFIFSSSLHGLIVADSLHVPNMRLKLSDMPMGPGFKFDDYYSGYGVECTAYQVTKDHVPTLDELKKNYSISWDLVDEKREKLYQVLQGYLREREL